MNNKKLKLILDTNIYISALGFDNLTLEFLGYCYQSEIIWVYLSNDIYQEIQECIFSSRFDKKTKNQISKEQKEEFLKNLIAISKIAKTKAQVKICRDLKDNKFLELAKAIQADYLITGDKDLLDLQNFEQTEIFKPSQFWKLLEN